MILMINEQVRQLQGKGRERSCSCALRCAAWSNNIHWCYSIARGGDPSPNIHKPKKGKTKGKGYLQSALYFIGIVRKGMMKIREHIIG